MADTIAVMNAGRIEQLGDPATLYERPATTFVANFLGQSNLLEATLTGERTDGIVTAKVHGHEVAVDAGRVPEGITEVWLGVRPEKLRLGEQGRNVLRGAVTDASFTGVATHYLVRMPWGHEITLVQQNDGSPRYAVGENVSVSWDPGHEFLLDQQQDEDAGIGIGDE